VLDVDKPIPGGWLEQGAFVSAVDMDAAFQGAALAEAATLVTDDRGQWEYFVGRGVFADYQAPCSDLGELCAVGKSGRHTDTEICAAVCMGIAAEDVTTAKLVYDAALGSGVGTVLPM
jgi:alanine dehydrogenase